MQILYFVIGFLLFISLILVHELGHFWAARRSGVEVEEFGLGFPPRAWSRKLRSGLRFSLNWLPLGGFVKLKGEHDAASGPGSFGAASLGSKTKILLAGVTANLITGLVLLTILALVGLPTLFDQSTAGQNQFTVNRDTKVTHQYVLAGDILTGSPAAHAGLSGHDFIESITSANQTYQITSADQLHNTTSRLAGQTVQLLVKHNDKQETKIVTLLGQAEVATSNGTKGYLGIVPFNLQIRRSTWSAPVVAVGLTGQLIELTAKGLWHAVSGLGSTIAGGVTGNHQARENGQSQASSQAAGPVAVVAILWGTSAVGLNLVVMVIAIISLTLAFVNLLPIPALDGGRLFVIALFRLMKKRLKPETEAAIHGWGMIVLLGLVVLITISDIHNV